MSTTTAISAQLKQQRTLFMGFGALTLVSIFAAIASELYFLAGLPLALLLAYLTIVDFRQVFYLLVFCIPLSTEITLPNGFGTDLPTEPLIVGLMLIFIFYLIRHGRELDKRFFLHPISLLLAVHLGWTLITTITSAELLVSVKFFLAKIWYVATFYFLAGVLLRREKDMRKFSWLVFVPLLLTVIVSVVRHAGYGFTFESVYRVLHPFYRNHVIYAAIIVVLFPFVWYLWQSQRQRSGRKFLLGVCLLFLLVAVQLSYTRAAMVSILIAGGAYYVIRYRLTRYAILLAVVMSLAGLAFFAYRNNYLNYAPNYERTITHTDFNNLLEATYQGEDISTMERVYRWIAGFYMSQDRPVFGWGPGNFYNFYKPFTVTSFRTYVSDNPERSGIHSYYLMVMVEQGYIGMLLFVLLVFVVLLKGEAIYHQLPDARNKRIAMTLLLSFIIILSLLIINDLIETDKIGSFFFIILAMLVNLDLGTFNDPPNAPSPTSDKHKG